MFEVVLQQAGPWGVVGGLLVLGVLKFVPRSYLRERDRLVELYVKALARETAARERAEKQVEELLLPYARAANKAISALPPAAASEGDRNAPVA